MRRLVLLLPLLVAGCGGDSPRWGAPALDQPVACRDLNAPPPGYQGPVSPHGLGCAPAGNVMTVPDGTHDYATGQPPRAVRGW